MKSIKNLKEDAAAILSDLDKMRSLCTQENRSPNEDERIFATKKLDEHDEIIANITLEEKTQRAIGYSKETDGVVHRPDISASTKKVHDEREHFANNGEFYHAVMRAAIPGGNVDPRLSTRAATGMSEGVPSDGGFLVDKDMAAGILTNVWNDSPVLSMVNKITLSGNKNGIKLNGLDETSRANGSRAGGIRAYWKAEAAAGTQGEPTFRKIELSLNKLFALAYATDELLEDYQALAQMIDNGFKDEIQFKLLDAIINGSGAGQPLGILNSGCMVSVGKQVGQSADTIVYENVLEMWSRLMAASRPNSVWMINQDCEPQLHQMSIAIGTGGAPVYLPQGGLSGSPFSTLFGRPVIPMEQVPKVGDTGDIILADMSKYIACDKGGIKNDVSMHVQFLTDQQVFRAIYRFDGQPMLGSAITPFSGSSNTLSHFVKLDARD